MKGEGEEKKKSRGRIERGKGQLNGERGDKTKKVIKERRKEGSDKQ